MSYLFIILCIIIDSVELITIEIVDGFRNFNLLLKGEGKPR